ncbi:MAG: hypothetical protein GY855_16410 [candidate division Zixibacteria bacterium]|nr:hypothetical protein [candidate division Zixibacteria bacterium]
MKRVLTIILLAFIVVSVGYLVGKDLYTRANIQDAAQKAVASNANKIIAYYFHGDVRCPSCTKIENYSQEAIVSGFPDELEGGSLEWQLINTDKPENAHYNADYQLFTKSLVIVEFKDGQQAQWKNLEKIWELLDDKDVFMKYVQHEIKTYLGET